MSQTPGSNDCVAPPTTPPEIDNETNAMESAPEEAIPHFPSNETVTSSQTDDDDSNGACRSESREADRLSPEQMMDSMLRHLLKVNDRSELVRDQMESRLGFGKRQRKRWRAELNALTNLICLNMETLEEFGLTSIPRVGRVSLSLHKIVHTHPTQDVCKDGLIAETYRTGFTKGGRPYRTALVAVFVYKPQRTVPGSQPQNGE